MRKSAVDSQRLAHKKEVECAPGDDPPEMPGEGPDAEIRHDRGASRGPASPPRRRADPCAARAVLGTGVERAQAHARATGTRRDLALKSLLEQAHGVQSKLRDSEPTATGAYVPVEREAARGHVGVRHDARPGPAVGDRRARERDGQGVDRSDRDKAGRCLCLDRPRLAGGPAHYVEAITIGGRLEAGAGGRPENQGSLTVTLINYVGYAVQAGRAEETRPLIQEGNGSPPGWQRPTRRTSIIRSWSPRRGAIDRG
jgi:hypothetical protein